MAYEHKSEESAGLIVRQFSKDVMGMRYLFCTELDVEVEKGSASETIRAAQELQVKPVR